MLTELEGAILSEVLYRGMQTAFQVRKSFADSPSLEWKGSAGAVYPAVKRLERDGLLSAAATGDGRATRLLDVTAEVKIRLFEWACAPSRGVSTGIDPFRMRSGIWLQLPPARRRTVMKAMRAAVLADLESLAQFARRKDVIERASVDLAIRLQKTRLEWIDDVLPQLGDA